MPKKNFVVEDLKLRLDKYLSFQSEDISRSQIQRDIETGLVLVNGKKILQSKFVVKCGDKIQYEESEVRGQELEIKAENIPLKILYDNHGLIIIDKPAGLAVHPGAGFKGNSLASALLYHFSAKGESFFGETDISNVGEKHRPGIVHRLDKDTSGVMLVAKTSEMYDYLKDAFAERKIKKEYIALVCGFIEKRHGFIETSIGKSKIDFRKYDVKDVIKEKDALTEYKVLEYLSPVRNKTLGMSDDKKDSQTFCGIDTYTLLLIKLHTGRTHQIRVHFNSIGHPIVGDSLYGSKKCKIQSLNRQFLHAKRIEVRLSGGTWIEAESELPEDLLGVLQELNSKVTDKL